MFSISNVFLYWSIDQITGPNAVSQKKFVNQTYEITVSCLRTNYYGTKHLTEALIPILEQSSSARIVNVSSTLGKLKVNTPYPSLSGSRYSFIIIFQSAYIYMEKFTTKICFSCSLFLMKKPKRS